jgi:hypothetical protein
MIPPTVDQTEGVWIIRTNDRGYYYIQEVFSKEASLSQSRVIVCLLLKGGGTTENGTAGNLCEQPGDSLLSIPHPLPSYRAACRHDPERWLTRTLRDKLCNNNKYQRVMASYEANTAIRHS